MSGWDLVAPLSPWQAEPKQSPPLPFQFSLLELYCFVALSIFFGSIVSYANSLDHSMDNPYLLVVQSVLIGVVCWLGAIYCLNKHRVTDQKRRIVSLMFIAPFGSLSYGILPLNCLLFVINALRHDFSKALPKLAIVLVCVSINVFCCKLSRWALTPPS